MFRSIFRQAQVQVETSLSHAVDKALLTVPFVIAVAFAVAALSVKLCSELGVTTGLVVLAALWLLVGVMAWVIYNMSQRGAATRRPVDDDSKVMDVTLEQGEGQPASSSEAEKELVMAVLATAAPMAVPHILRLAFRNLPLLAGVAAATYVLSRPSTADGVSTRSGSGGEPFAAPAE